MAKKPEFDLQAAHKYFAVYCFNKAWDYIDKPVRTSAEADTMLDLSMSSLWHWTQREDCTTTNLSIGYWQVSRVYALLRQADNARHYAKLCLEAAQQDGVAPFQLGYAYEALARAESVAGNLFDKDTYLSQARQVAANVANEGDRKHLLGDLETIQ